VAATFEWKRVVWDISRDRYERTLGFVKEVLGLDEFFNSLARELSLGQRMRADMGLALLHEPGILFLDEPTIGVDVLAKRNMLDFIKDLNRTQHVTIMLTSHDMSELEQLAGRIIMIDHGAIAFDGDFGTLRRQFTDRRHLLIETADGIVPDLRGAELIKSEANRHEYTFDAAHTGISDLLDQVSEQTQILDVETHRVSIDDVIADLYTQWKK
jgi:ABC-2 type transport system ATP-binding protein